MLTLISHFVLQHQVQRVEKKQEERTEETLQLSRLYNMEHYR